MKPLKGSCIHTRILPDVDSDCHKEILKILAAAKRKPTCRGEK